MVLSLEAILLLRSSGISSKGYEYAFIHYTNPVNVNTHEATMSQGHRRPEAAIIPHAFSLPRHKGRPAFHSTQVQEIWNLVPCVVLGYWHM